MRNVLLLLLGLLPLCLMAQHNGGFVINGNINGLPDNSVVYLAVNGENDTLAKTTVKENKFILTGKCRT